MSSTYSSYSVSSEDDSEKSFVDYTDRSLEELNQSDEEEEDEMKYVCKELLYIKDQYERAQHLVDSWALTLSLPSQEEMMFVKKKLGIESGMSLLEVFDLLTQLKCLQKHPINSQLLLEVRQLVEKLCMIDLKNVERCVQNIENIKKRLTKSTDEQFHKEISQMSQHGFCFDETMTMLFHALCFDWTPICKILDAQTDEHTRKIYLFAIATLCHALVTDTDILAAQRMLLSHLKTCFFIYTKKEINR